GPIVKLLEVVRRIEETVPLEAQPLHVFHDRFNVLGFFFRWIGVVKTQVALTAKLGGQPEVEADSFGMADVQVAVWLWRKAGLYTAPMFAVRNVLDHDVSNKIRRPTGCL